MARGGIGPAAPIFYTRAANVNPFLRMSWRHLRGFGTTSRAANEVFGVPKVWSISPESAEQFLALAIGFAVAGLMSSGYQLVTERPPSFRLLEQGANPATFAAIPFLVFAAPFIIMRNTIRGRVIERRRFEFVMVATVIAGVWSLMSGTVVVMAFEQVARVIG